MIKKITVFCFFSFLFVALHSQEKISVEWQSALGGNVVAAPKRTSYGFILLSEGRILNAATEDGTIIWRRNIKGSPSKYFSVTAENFVFITTDNAKKLSLYNPDGAFLWEAVLESPVISDPLPGRDGRVFVLEEQAISCYGANGKRKWRTEVDPSGGFGLVEMNDGSILYVLESSDSKTNTAIRISPYGNVIEEIVFIDSIVTLSAYNDGVILGFNNGAIGSCAVVDGSTKTISSIQKKEHNLFARDIIIGSKGFCVIYSDNSIAEYSLSNLSLLWSTNLSSHYTLNDTDISYIGNTFVFTGIEYVCAYFDNSSNRAGELAWEKYIDSSNDSYFPLLTRSAYLVVARPNWILAGFQLFDDDTVLEVKTQVESNHSTSYQLRDFQSSRRVNSTSTISEQLQRGDYGSNEIGYIQTIDSLIESYTQEYFSFSQNYNVSEKSLVLYLSSLFESSYFNYVVPLLLENEEDPYFIELAFKVASNIGYDPHDIMLRAIEDFYATHKTLISEKALLSLCDAVYEICLYMGKPALTARGKQILSEVLQTSGSVSVQQKVGETLYLFIGLEN